MKFKIGDKVKIYPCAGYKRIQYATIKHYYDHDGEYLCECHEELSYCVPIKYMFKLMNCPKYLYE